jgi:uncharacterized metal-binding protein YceD (DUF177 family)
MEKTQTPWSVPVAVESIPETGLYIAIEAPAAARTELATIAGLRELHRLSAEFDLTRRGAGARVTGRISAQVGQTCVVTLEPVENDLEERVDLVFASAPAESMHTKVEAADKKVNEEEPQELLVGGQLDLGAIATEFLLLGVDPYPRKKDAEFAPPKADDSGAHPFAALETLKKRLGSG